MAVLLILVGANHRFLSPQQSTTHSAPFQDFFAHLSALRYRRLLLSPSRRDQRPSRIDTHQRHFNFPSSQAFKRFLCLEHRTRGGILRTNPAFVSDPFQGTTKRSGCPGTSKMESHPPTKRHFASYACMCVFTSGCDMHLSKMECAAAITQ